MTSNSRAWVSFATLRVVHLPAHACAQIKIEETVGQDSDCLEVSKEPLFLLSPRLDFTNLKYE